MSKIEGKLVLSMRANKEKGVVFTHPKDYSAMDFAWILQLWALYTGRKQEPLLTREVWDVLRRQKKDQPPSCELVGCTSEGSSEVNAFLCTPNDF